MADDMHQREVRLLGREAARYGVRLWVENGQLHSKATKGDPPEKLRVSLEVRRDELIGELSKPVFRKRGGAPQLLRYPDFWQDFWQETQAHVAPASAA